LQNLNVKKEEIAEKGKKKKHKKKGHETEGIGRQAQGLRRGNKKNEKTRSVT